MPPPDGPVSATSSPFVEVERDVLERADPAVLEALPHVPNVDCRAAHLTTLTGNAPIPFV